ncbi:proline-rich protein 22 [Anolis carolinensis]|uniref:proline-rich protein 22 n=1 Tax=Anolis carolinensis TaxID=28377 RepID=UPI002F2B8E88
MDGGDVAPCKNPEPGVGGTGRSFLPGNRRNRTVCCRGNKREAMQPPQIFFSPQHEALLRPENLASVGFHMAPCGCFFDPRIYRIEWAASSASTATFAPPASSVYKLSAPPRSAFLLEPKPRPSPQAPPPVALPPDHEGPGPDLEAGPSLWEELEEEEEEAGLLGGEEPKVTQDEGGKGEASLFLPDKVLLEVAMKLFDCSPPDAEAQAASAGRGRARRAASCPGDDIRSLHLPEELLSFDYSVPEAAPSALDFLFPLPSSPPPQEEEQEAEAPPQDDDAPT